MEWNSALKSIHLKLLILLTLKTVMADVGYSAPSYSAPSYSAPSYSAPSYSAPSYSAPSYSAPSYAAPESNVHTHHHYHYGAPAETKRPSYKRRPSYGPPRPQYYEPANYGTYASQYDYGYGHGGSSYEDEYIHLNKKELTKGALLLGAGVLKGVLLTGLINNANNGINIGK